MASVLATQTNVYLILWQIIFILFYAFQVDYGDSAHPDKSPEWRNAMSKEDQSHYYPMFQDVHVMIFIGFGYLMTFLKRYGFSSVGYNLLIGGFVIQLSMLVTAVITATTESGRWHITYDGLINAEFSCAVSLITMGALLGKVSLFQLLLVCTIETVCFKINEHIGYHLLHVADLGGSMFLHTFGAYFGLAVSRVLARPDVIENAPAEGSVYHSDVFAMIGTIFLWMFWPSFNAALGTQDERERAVINTYLSLAACCVVAFAMSSCVDWIHKRHEAAGEHEDKWEHKIKFDMVHIQNATLAGGVAIGTAANMQVHPFGAMIVGSVAAILSVFGFKFVTPWLRSRVKLHDTCGVNNLHGMPGILAGIVGIITAALATEQNYGDSLFEVWEARKRELPTTMAAAAHTTPAAHSTNSTGGHGVLGTRTASEQALFQFYALLMTLAFSIVTGLITGLIVKWTCCLPLNTESLYEDREAWEVPAFHPFVPDSGVIHVTSFREHADEGETELMVKSKTHKVDT